MLKKFIHCASRKFSVEFQSDDYRRIVQTTWCWDEKKLRWEQLCVEFSVLNRNTVFLGQDLKNHSSAIQGPIKHVVFLFFFNTGIKTTPSETFDWYRFLQNAGKPHLFSLFTIFILSRCQWWKKFRTWRLTDYIIKWLNDTEN